MIRSDDEGNDGQRSASPTGSSDANHNLKSGKESDTFLSVRDDTSSSSSSHSSADVESNLSAPPRPSVTPTERHDEALTEAVDAHQLTNHRGFPDVRQQRIRYFLSDSSRLDVLDSGVSRVMNSSFIPSSSH